MTERGKFIVVEGLDGVGKTTTINRLAERLQAAKLKTPPDEIASIREQCATSTTAELRLHYYMLGNYLVAEEIKKRLAAGENVVLDRFYASTMAYMWGFGRLPFSNTDWPPNLLRPDYTFVLNLPRDARIERLAARTTIAHTAEELKLKIAPDIEERVLDYYSRFGCTDVAITPDMTTDQICDSICAYITEHPVI
jgi:thymidylate kinase